MCEKDISETKNLFITIIMEKTEIDEYKLLLSNIKSIKSKNNNKSQPLSSY